MKHAIWFVGFCCFGFATKHNLILQFDQPVDILQTLSAYSLLNVRQLADRPVYKVKIDSPLNRQDLLDELYNLPLFLSAEENQEVQLQEPEAAASIDSRAIFILDDIDSRAIFILDDIDSRAIFILDQAERAFAPLFGQYYVTQIRANDAWPYASGEGVTVAVLDTGVDGEHPFLIANMVPGYDFIDNDADPREERLGLDSNENGSLDEGWGHGTHVAGILKTIAPRVSIMPIRVADSDGRADVFNIVQGIVFAIFNGADIINLSMSIDDPSPLLEEWLKLAKFANVVVVTSAGNDNSGTLKFPSTESEVITVTSVGPDNVKSPFSNYSKYVDVAAPGEMIVAPLPDGLYIGRSGTSMATPMVAGEAAIILDLVPGASVEYVQHRIKNKARNINSDNPGYRNLLGRGLADVWNSITLQNQ